MGQEIKCGDCNKYGHCTTCGEECGSNGHFIEAFSIEREAMDLLKDKWNHLYTFGYPTIPFPTNYAHDLAIVKLGIYEGAKTHGSVEILEELARWKRTVEKMELRCTALRDEIKKQQATLYTENEVIHIQAEYNKHIQANFDPASSILPFSTFFESFKK